MRDIREAIVIFLLANHAISIVRSAHHPSPVEEVFYRDPKFNENQKLPIALNDETLKHSQYQSYYYSAATANNETKQDYGLQQHML
jgi:hypothetical protein